MMKIMVERSISNYLNPMGLKDPYHLFFRYGWLMGLLFLLVWPLHIAEVLETYPGFFHAHGIISLFLGSFIVGFLLTALPRFTGSAAAGPVWIRTQFTMAVIELALLLSGEYGHAAMITSLRFLTLAMFAVSRIRKAQIPPPPSFAWVGLGLVSVIIGAFGSSLAEWGVGNDSWFPFYKALFQRAFPIALFIGVGGRLVPILSGVRDNAVLQITLKPSKSYRALFAPHAALALLFLVGLYLETVASGRFEQTGLVFQALSLFAELAFFWDLYKMPEKHARAFGVWASAWSIFLGIAAAAVYPAYKVHLLHLTFAIGLFGGTLVIASHVIVSHERKPQLLLAKFFPLGLVWSLVLLAGLTRATAPIASYSRHLSYAALSGGIALGLWAWMYFKTQKQNSEAPPH